MTSIYAGSGHLKIGLLGGSFNPAHAGHRQISLAALKRLRLDQVWWLVTPQNPLKSSDHTLPVKLRIEQALKVADHPKIRITGIEEKLGMQYSADTLKTFRRRFKNYHFIWLMGADNLIQISSWRRWKSIFKHNPLAVFSRPGYSLHALSSKAAQIFRKNRITPAQAQNWEKKMLPAWVFFRGSNNFLSSTQIRAQDKYAMKYPNETQRIYAFTHGETPLPVGVKICCQSNRPEQSLQKVQEIMAIIIQYRITYWPSDQEWANLLPSWFFEQFHTHSLEELLSNPALWEFGSWLDAMKNPNWEWWSCSISKSGWNIWLTAQSDPYNIGPLEYLIRSTGSTVSSIDELKTVPVED